jgi:hypothetical protein
MAMLFMFENADTETDTSFLKHATLWGPDSGEENNERDDSDWDEDGGGIDDPTEDLDDMHEIQADDDLNEPDPEDDEHFPEEDE